MSYQDNLQQYIEQFRREVNDGEIDLHELAAWMIRNGYWEAPFKSQAEILCRDLGAAMRSQSFEDEHGRKVRRKHNVKRKIGMRGDTAIYQTVWCDIDVATGPFMQASFAQRRNGIANIAFQLHSDVSYWNEVKNPGEPIQMLMDFRDDIADREQANLPDDDSVEIDVEELHAF